MVGPDVYWIVVNVRPDPDRPDLEMKARMYASEVVNAIKRTAKRKGAPVFLTEGDRLPFGELPARLGLQVDWDYQQQESWPRSVSMRMFARVVSDDSEPIALSLFLLDGLNRESEPEHIRNGALHAARRLLAKLPDGGGTATVGSQTQSDRITAAIEWALHYNAAVIEALRDENSRLRREIAELRESSQFDLRVEPELLVHTVRNINEHLEAARRQSSFWTRAGWLVLGGAIAFGAQVGADHLSEDPDQGAVAVDGRIDAGSISIADVIMNNTQVAIAINPSCSTTASTLPFVK